MQVIKGDLTKIQKGVIIHQVNAQAKMGAGIALAIRKAYPQHYTDYMAKCRTVTKTSDLLGDMVITKVNKYLAVIGLFGQDYYGRDRRYTDYQAVQKALQNIARLHAQKTTIHYYIPYKMGCNLAGGSWAEMEKIIDAIAPFIIAVKKED